MGIEFRSLVACGYDNLRRKPEYQERGQSVLVRGLNYKGNHNLYSNFKILRFGSNLQWSQVTSVSMYFKILDSKQVVDEPKYVTVSNDSSL